MEKPGFPAERRLVGTLRRRAITRSFVDTAYTTPLFHSSFHLAESTQLTGVFRFGIPLAFDSV
jgi:hypothetical protein